MPKHTVINGQLVTEPGASGAAPRVAGDFRNQFKAPGQVGTDPSTGKPMLGQETLGTGEVKFAPAGTNISVGNLTAKGDDIALTKTFEVLDTSRKGIFSAQKGFDSAKRLYDLMSDPDIISGFGGDVTLFLARVGSKLGIGGADATAKTQSAMADMARQTLKEGEAMVGAFSNQDIIFLKEVASGNINFDAATVKRAAALGMVAGHNGMMQNYAQFSAAGQSKGAEPIAKLFPTPAIKHSIPFDTDPRFTEDAQTGRITYKDLAGTRVSGTAAAAANAKPGRISFDQFMKQ